MSGEGTRTSGALRFRWTSYLFVLGGVLMATVLRFPVQPVIHNVSPFLFYFPIVLAMALLFGFRFGLAAMSLSILPANYFWMFPENTFEINLSDLCQIVSLSVTGVSVSWLGESSRRKRILAEHLRSALASMSDAVVTVDGFGRIVSINEAAKVLIERSDEEAVGMALGAAVNLLDEEGCPLGGRLEYAPLDRGGGSLPKRGMIVSKTGRRHRTELRLSPVLDGRGRVIGHSILFLGLDAEAKGGAVGAQGRGKDLMGAGSGLPRVAMVFTGGGDGATAKPDAGIGQRMLYILEVSKKLAQFGYEVDVWTNRPAEDFPVEEVAPRVQVIRLLGGGGAGRPGEFSRGLAEWNQQVLQAVRERRLKYEFVNSHFWVGGLAGQALAGALGVPHVHTPHTIGLEERESGGGEDLKRRIREERSIYAATDLLVASSQEQRDRLIAHYQVPRAKCPVLKSGYDDARFFAVDDFARQNLRLRLGFTGPVLVARGDLANERGCEHLIRAFATVVRHVPTATLRLATAGKSLSPQEQTVFFRLRALVTELSLRQQIHFRDALREEELPDYYRAADIMVFCNCREGERAPASEAMACGTPAVFAGRDGLEYAINFGQYGFHADPRNPEDFGLTLVRILTHPPLQWQLRRLCSGEAHSLFTWTRVAQQLISLTKSRERETTRQDEGKAGGGS